MIFRTRRGGLAISGGSIAAVIALFAATSLTFHATSQTAGPRPSGSTSVAGALELSQALGSESSMGSKPLAGGIPSDLYQRLVEQHAHQHATTGCENVPNPGYLHTDGKWIEDVNNCHVRLATVTWYGMQTTFFVPAGLNFLRYTDILAEVKRLGFNSIRVPISDDAVRYNSKERVSKKYILANSDLKGLHPLGMLDRIITAAQKLGLMIILDNHFTKARTPSSYGENSVRNSSQPTGACSRGEAIWSCAGYTEQDWINDWLTLTHRYFNNPTVIGYDLRNEPHTNGPGPWTLKTYLTQGATWGPYPSKLWKASTDFRQAATNAGNQILAVNPHLLMFVEGTELWPDKAYGGGVEAYWWGSILRGVKNDPVVFKVPHQLVYSPHEWGPWHFKHLGQFNAHTSYASMSSVFNKNWAYILNSTNPAVQAPIWLGEFNTCNIRLSCVTSKKKGSQGQWFQIIINYLKANPEIGWSYYPLNGTNSFDQPSNNSVLRKDWTRVKLKPLMEALTSIESQPPN